MFIGWVAYFTRGHSFKDGMVNLACVVLGIVFGVIAALAIAVLMPRVGSFSFAIVVFGIASIVVSLRAAPVLNNVLAYFLGLIDSSQRASSSYESLLRSRVLAP
jgi:Protein of unknown function (DUF1097)